MAEKRTISDKYHAVTAKMNLSKKLEPVASKCRAACAPIDRLFEKVNKGMENSFVNKVFKLKERKTTFSTELRAGTVNFLTMAYILSVNANIISDTGGTCSPQDCTGPLAGEEFCIFTDPGYLNCVAEFKKSLTSATALGACIMCILMGFIANMPIALAPGMGLNAYFAYTVVGFRGTGSIDYKVALAAVFIEGFIFILLSVSGIRGKLITYVPKSIMLATSAGIGMFLAFIGLQASEGIGVVTYDPATLVHIGGCPPENRVIQFSVPGFPTDVAACNFNLTSNAASNYETCTSALGVPSNTYKCVGGEMTSATMWLGISGGIIIAILMKLNAKGAILIGVLFAAVIAWIPGHAASYLGSGSPIPGGQARLDYFKEIVAVPQFSNVLFQFDFSGFASGKLWVALITFLYVDFLDATGTMYSMANFINIYLPGFVNQERKTFERQLHAFCVDGVGASVGACLGMSPIVAYIESGAGIREGGRTGITAIMTGIYFFIALWFTPVFANVAVYATGPALILVGSMMMTNIAGIEWRNPQKSIPAFLTIILMPLTYSIAYGVIGGLCAYIILGLSTWPVYTLFPDWTQDRRSWETELGHDGAVPFEGARPGGIHEDTIKKSVTEQKAGSDELPVTGRVKSADDFETPSSTTTDEKTKTTDESVTIP